MKKIRVELLILMLVLIFGGVTGKRETVSAEVIRNQSVIINGVYHYYDENGQMVKGWYTADNGDRYYFSKITGEAKPGIRLIGGKRYIFDEKGKMQKKWLTWNGKRYYCGADGVIRVGWHYNSTDRYYYGTTGVIVVGFRKVGSHNYYFNRYGKALKNIWISKNGQKYYFDEKGRMVTGWKYIDNSRYYFEESGAMHTGWLEYKDRTYYFDQNGKRCTGWTEIDGKIYCLTLQYGTLKKNCFSGERYVGREGYWIPDYQKIFSPIMGKTTVTLQQLVSMYEWSGRIYPEKELKEGGAETIQVFCKTLMEEAITEGVRAEVLYAQVMLETGWLQFGGDVKIEQYNFGGIGAIGGGVPGNSFTSVREGLRAQAQHLKAYGSTEELKNPCVDPRFQYVTRGKTPYVEWLGIKANPYGYGWAGGSDYGFDLVDLIKRLKRF